MLVISVRAYMVALKLWIWPNLLQKPINMNPPSHRNRLELTWPRSHPESPSQPQILQMDSNPTLSHPGRDIIPPSHKTGSPEIRIHGHHVSKDETFYTPCYQDFFVSGKPARPTGFRPCLRFKRDWTGFVSNRIQQKRDSP